MNRREDIFDWCASLAHRRVGLAPRKWRVIGPGRPAAAPPEFRPIFRFEVFENADGFAFEVAEAFGESLVLKFRGGLAVHLGQANSDPIISTGVGRSSGSSNAVSRPRSV
jgi:hypothetical protein